MCIRDSFYPREFLNVAVLKATVLAMSSIAVIAVGMTVLLVSGGFDLSVGSIVTLTGVAAALVVKAGFPWYVAMAAGIAGGIIVGLGNGLMIAKLRINPFITTLGMMIFVRGFSTILAGGNNISILDQSYNWIGQASVAGIQLPIWACLFFVILGDFLLRKSRYFRQNSTSAGMSTRRYFPAYRLRKSKYSIICFRVRWLRSQEYSSVLGSATDLSPPASTWNSRLLRVLLSEAALFPAGKAQFSEHFSAPC